MGFTKPTGPFGVLRSRTKALTVVIWMIFIFSISLQAQIATGRLTGTVRDLSGAVISGAKISLTNDATGAVTTVPSTSTGTYVFQAVNPGTYKLQGQPARVLEASPARAL